MTYIDHEKKAFADPIAEVVIVIYESRFFSYDQWEEEEQRYLPIPSLIFHSLLQHAGNTRLLGQISVDMHSQRDDRVMELLWKAHPGL